MAFLFCPDESRHALKELEANLPGFDRSKPAVFVLFFASGAVGLVYQIVWLRQLTLIFGATAYATSAVLSTFMGGLALGSYWAGRRADRWLDPPLRIYGKLELGIAVYAAAIPWLLDRATALLDIAWRLGADRHFALLGFIKFIAIAILILPATTMMGAPLPVLSRLAAQTSRSLAKFRDHAGPPYSGYAPRLD